MQGKQLVLSEAIYAGVKRVLTNESGACAATSVHHLLDQAHARHMRHPAVETQSTRSNKA